MIALATLALQSAKKLFQKGNLVNKIWHVILTLSGADIHAQSIGIDPSFRIKLCENPALNWPWFMRQSGVKWLAQTYRGLYQLFRLRWRESIETPMFVGASQSTTLVMPLWRWHCINYSKKTVIVDCCFSRRAVSMLIRQRASQMGGDFSLWWRQGREKSGIPCSERLFMIYCHYKKNEWVDFHIIGWLFSHTAATQLCSNTI